jgi:hypothetical protein
MIAHPIKAARPARGTAAVANPTPTTIRALAKSH